MIDTFRFTIDVPVRSWWADIQRVRGSVEECLQAVFSEVGPIDALAMTTGELLENAVKYGHWGPEGGRFRLCVSGSLDGATVVVDNPVAGADAAAGVRETLAFLARHDSAAAAYRARLLELAQGPRGTGGGLGLLRVAYEGGATLSHQLDGEHLRVVATLVFDQRAA